MKPCDTVKIITAEKEFTGILMPQEKPDTIFIKLDSGYNTGIAKKNIKKIEMLKKAHATFQTKGKGTLISATSNTILPTISILHTGGTIASKVDYATGGVVARFSPEELLSIFPELGRIVHLRSKLIANMWSDDLRFAHFTKIAHVIETEVKAGVEGIIVGIGTDNLAVAACALAFVLEECPVPVIFVGAQRSSDRGSSDAALNLLCAAHFITSTDFAGVGICMHESLDDKTCILLPPCKTKKMHSSRRDAFKSVNDIPIARIDGTSGGATFLTEKYIRKDPKKKIVLKPFFEERTGLLKIHVNMSPKEFEFFKGYKGIVIEGTGFGHTPLDVIDESTKIHEKIKKAIFNLNKSGTVIIMTTQCIFGRVNMNVYSKGRDLQALGVISGEDMLAETAFIKLAWLLGNYPKEKVKELVCKNLRGEINQRITENEFL